LEFGEAAGILVLELDPGRTEGIPGGERWHALPLDRSRDCVSFGPELVALAGSAP
jgi:hypothetical protein